MTRSINFRRTMRSHWEVSQVVAGTANQIREAGPDLAANFFIPLGAPGCSAAKPTLVAVVNEIKLSLDLQGTPVGVLESACVQLGVTGENLMVKAIACYAQLT